MPFVLDASVAASWMLPDEQSTEALRARTRLASEGGLVPPHWWYEIRNTMLMAECRSRLPMELVQTALLQLAKLPIEITDQRDEDAIFATARRHRLTFYDAAYVALAQREKIALATLDRQLATAALAEHVQLVIAI
jgi:predicted nucleic acid-binding protein